MAVAKETMMDWPEAIWQLDLESNIFTWESNSISGFNPNGDGLESWYQSIHPEDLEQAKSALSNALATKRLTWTSQYRWYNAPEEPAVERRIFNKGIILYKDGQAVKLINTLTDITEETCPHQEKDEHTRQSLLETQQKLYTLVDNSVDLMSILEMDGKNSYINKAGLELLGFDTEEEMRETPIAELHTPEDFKFVQEEVLPSVMTVGRWSGTMLVKHKKTGEIFPVVNNTLRIDDPETGAPIAVGAVMRDLRPEMKAKQALLESEHRYRTLSEELEERVKQRTKDLTEANLKLENSNVELEQYAYVASHDLQEPLRKIRIFSGMLNEMELSQEAKGLLTKVINSAERMSLLIKDLLEFSRLIQSEKKTRPTNLNAVLKNVVSDFELVMKEKSAIVESDVLPSIEAVPLQMNQLLYNLISNALKFTREGVPPKITITYKTIEKEELQQLDILPVQGVVYYDISIADNGIGFDTKYAEQIFEVFRRLHTSNTFSGSGIGLALCRRIVKNHNGVLRAHSVEGKGTTMHIILPATQNESTTLGK